MFEDLDFLFMPPQNTSTSRRSLWSRDWGLGVGENLITMQGHLSSALLIHLLRVASIQAAGVMRPA